ncbi:hypothetical protein [Candidatus Enterovibrio altilux]|uniref:Mobile element protein n=1 Tax=Candidatus Enterovibrio altilux TaxID=1927128 RepID=A0A291B8T9_9GAMM|nr:hypothetical protein [Candidatus Enterovibrio luxaltus]ATF09436.1 Mobile element protein [Candidatus Enterovibrio luxaltus]
MLKFIIFVCKFAQLPLSFSCYPCISKRVKMINIEFKMMTQKIIQHLTIDFTELTVLQCRQNSFCINP